MYNLKNKVLAGALMVSIALTSVGAVSAYQSKPPPKRTPKTFRVTCTPPSQEGLWKLWQNNKPITYEVSSEPKLYLEVNIINNQVVGKIKKSPNATTALGESSGLLTPGAVNIMNFIVNVNDGDYQLNLGKMKFFSCVNKNKFYYIDSSPSGQSGKKIKINISTYD